MAFLKLVAKRLVAQRLLALALLVTMGFSIGVLVAGPIYAYASQQAILTGQLSQSPVHAKNIRFLVFSGPGFEEGATDRAVRQAARQLPVNRIIPMAETLSATVEGPQAVMQIPFLYREGAFSHIKFEGNGRAPQGPDEVALAAGPSLQTGLEKGDILLASTGDGQTKVSLHITGIFNPPSIRDPFWFGAGTPFPTEQTRSAGLGAGASTNGPSPILVSHAGYEFVSSKLNLLGQFTWDTYLNLSAQNFDQINGIPGQLEGIIRDLRKLPGLAHLTGTTGIDGIVQVAEQRTANLRVPIYLVVFQIGAVALAVLAGVASLALSRQSFELAVLKSRGFTRRQLLIAQAIESSLSALAAFPLGLALGMALARLARSSNGPSVAGSQFPIVLTTPAIIAGAIGAFVGVLLLVLVSLPYISRTVLQERQEASRETRPFIARFPLEIFIGLLGLAAFYEVKTRGISPTLNGTIDPLVLLAPTLLLFAASFAALRLLLWVFRKMDPVIARARGLSTYLAGRRLGRSASTSFATALLLILAAGLLVVSTSYRATILRSHSDNAQQQVGSDWKVETDPAPQSLATMRRLPGGMTGIFRGEADPVNSQQAIPVQVLGIDLGTYADVGYWRSDYSTDSVTTVLSNMAVPPAGVALPTGTDTLQLDVETPRPYPDLTISAMVETPGQTVRQVKLGALTGGAQTFRAPDQGGTKLLSMVIERTTGTESPERITLQSLHLQAVTPSGSTSIDLTGWSALEWRISGGTQVTGDGTVRMVAGTGSVVAGMIPPNDTIPVYASADVASATGREFQADVGGARMSFRIVNVLPGFPGMPPGQPFMIVSEQAIFERTQRVPEPSVGLVEVWAKGPSSPAQTVRKTGLFVDSVLSAREIEATLAQLPQSLAIGMHFTAAAGGMALVVIGVAVGLYFGQRRRRFEFAALRAMGSEPSQTVGALVGEQGVLVGFSMLAAFALGYGLLRVMMPYLRASIGVPFPVPILVLDWLALAVFAVAVLGATSLGLLLAARALLRASVTAVLRGEPE